MDKRLVVASLNYSSWSVRAWLALKHAKIPFSIQEVPLQVAPGWKEQILAFSGAGRVPILMDGALTIHESLAICEYAAELEPGARLWPENRDLRAKARAISCEMLSNFAALRDELSMNARGRVRGFAVSEAVCQEIIRATSIWSDALQRSGGPYLFGHFTIADCMYLPVLSRFRTYRVELEGDALAYDRRMWQNPVVKEWYAIALSATAIPVYDEEFQQRGGSLA